jgi:hypothetical protein
MTKLKKEKESRHVRVTLWFFLRVDYNLEYENLEKLYLESVLISKKKTVGISKKNDGNLEFNLE